MHDSKVCFKCGESQLLTEFYKHAGMADGHLGKCKGCTKKDTKDTVDVSKFDKKEIQDKIEEPAKLKEEGDDKVSEKINARLMKLKDNESGNILWIDTNDKLFRKQFATNKINFESNLKEIFNLLNFDNNQNNLLNYSPLNLSSTDTCADANFFSKSDEPVPGILKGEIAV